MSKRTASLPIAPPSSPRAVAWQILIRYEQTCAWHIDETQPPGKRLLADTLIDEALEAHGQSWDSRDRGFLTALVYGTLRFWYALTQRLQALSHHPLVEMPPAVRALVRMGLYQRWGMDLPAHAVTHETTALAKAAGWDKHPKSQHWVALVNALMRSHERTNESSPIAEINDATLLASVPPWFSDCWQAHWQPNALQPNALCTPKPTTVRVNPLKATPDEMTAAFTEASMTLQPQAKGIYTVLSETGTLPPVRTWPGIADGRVVIQDAHSVAVGNTLLQALTVAHNACTIVELGAAPGGKTAVLAAGLQNQGGIHAIDISPKRLARMSDTLAKLGVTNTVLWCGDLIQGLETVEAIGDAAPPSLTPAMADAVLVDAPCSSLGTWRHQPDVVIQAHPKVLAQFAQTQQALVLASIPLLKPYGVLVYSTCTLRPEENEAVITAVCQHAPSMTVVSQQYLPPSALCDGFFVAVLRKQS